MITARGIYMGARAKSWCPLMYAKAALSLSFWHIQRENDTAVESNLSPGGSGCRGGALGRARLRRRQDEAGGWGGVHARRRLPGAYTRPLFSSARAAVINDRLKPPLSYKSCVTLCRKVD